MNSKDILDMELYVKTPANLSDRMKEDLYIYGLQHFKNTDPELKRRSDEECLTIVKKMQRRAQKRLLPLLKNPQGSISRHTEAAYGK